MPKSNKFALDKLIECAKMLEHHKKGEQFQIKCEVSIVGEDALDLQMLWKLFEDKIKPDDLMMLIITAGIEQYKNNALEMLDTTIAKAVHDCSSCCEQCKVANVCESLQKIQFGNFEEK